MDENDNDLVRFLSYFINAINQIEGINLLLEEVLGILQSPGPEAVETLLISIINEIAACQVKIIFILDDCHQIESPSIQTALNFTLENLPP